MEYDFNCFDGSVLNAIGYGLKGETGRDILVHDKGRAAFSFRVEQVPSRFCTKEAAAQSWHYVPLASSVDHNQGAAAISFRLQPFRWYT